MSAKQMSLEERIATGREALQHALTRDASFQESAITFERAGNYEGTWLAMAARAHNRRWIERLESDLKDLESKLELGREGAT